MNDSLRAETEKLARSWSQYEAPFLQDYLVADVEDPRINVQSILSRHFLLGTLLGDRIQPILTEELHFAAALNWLLQLNKRAGDTEELDAVLYALKRGADNAEGLEIPHFLVQTFASLPVPTYGIQIPNYIKDFLTGTRAQDSQSTRNGNCLDTFLSIWKEVLSHETPQHISVLEPACGSANDYRFLDACGIVAVTSLREAGVKPSVRLFGKWNMKLTLETAWCGEVLSLSAFPKPTDVNISTRSGKPAREKQPCCAI